MMRSQDLRKRSRSLSKSNADKIEVYRHGKTYSEADEIEKSYPFQLCPECMSQDTEIILHDKNSLTQTGHKRWEREGIFNIKIVTVRHVCKSCGCKWVHEFEDKKERSSITVNDRTVSIILGLLGFFFGLFFIIGLMTATAGSAVRGLECVLVIAGIIASVAVMIAGMVALIIAFMD